MKDAARIRESHSGTPLLKDDGQNKKQYSISSSENIQHHSQFTRRSNQPQRGAQLTVQEDQSAQEPEMEEPEPIEGA